jgi:hypothetical protein
MLDQAKQRLLVGLGAPLLLVLGGWWWWGHFEPPDNEWGLKVRIARGDTRAMLRMGDLTQEIKWIQMAADHGDPGAYFSLGNLNQSRNPRRAFEYYLKGAEIEARTRQSRVCIIEVSKAYEYGLYGIHKNQQETDKWDKIGVEIGMADMGLAPRLPKK